ncbi:MAG: DUF2314 domain-containing protein [Myxococcales bacterium]|nr:DUF2314 domain-containing protein [Myxococcales bacterium]
MLMLLVSAAAAMPIVPDARFALALYCNPRCTDTTVDALDAALAAIAATDSFSEHVAAPQRIMGMAGAEFAIPAVEGQAALALSEQVLLAWFAGPREAALNTLSTAHAAFGAAARQSGGWVEDLDAQVVYDAGQWMALDPRGDLATWYVIDQTELADGSERLRLVTRGLRRFGDFELVVEEVSRQRVDDVAWTIAVVAEAVHPLGDVGEELLITTPEARGTARFAEVTEPRPDDPGGPLLRLTFSGELIPAVASSPEPGPRAPERVETSPEGPALAIPAADTSAVPTTLEAAREAVRRALVTLESRWRAGLPPGDVLAVSAPFPTRAGPQEYLWIEISGWQEGGISGRLATEPYDVPGLHRGDRVTVPTAQVYDYVLRRADGQKTGNLTRPFR